MKKKRAVKVPMIMQMEALECGAASLAMVLAYYKKWIPLEQVREDCGVSRDGSNAAHMLKAARKYGLEGRAWSYHAQTLEDRVTFPAVIHWNFNHFVVLCGFSGKYAVINDPARGTVKVTKEEFRRSYTGICMGFEPGKDFVREGKRASVFSFLRRCLRGAKGQMLFAMLAAVLISFIGMVTPVYHRIFADRLLVGKNSAWTFGFLASLFAIASLRLLLGVINEVYLYKIKGKLAMVSHVSFFRHMLKLPMSFYSQRMAGDLAGRQKLNNSVADTLVSKMAPLLVNMALLVFYVLIMLRYSLPLTVAGLAAVVGNLVLARVISSRRIQTTRIRMQYEGKLHASTLAGIDMIETIKASGAEQGYFGQWAGYQAMSHNAKIEELKQQRFLSGLPVLIQELSDLVILVLGAYLIMKGMFSAGMLLTFQSLMDQFMAPVEGLLDAGQSIQEMRTSMERIDDVMKYKEDPGVSTVALEEQKSYKKLKGKIEIKNVTFGYSRLSPPLLKNFSLTIEPGERVALVGASACGKSTIAKLLCGLYEPWEGEILFDGKPIRHIPEKVFHGSLAMVDQDITVFEDSVGNNIKLWDTSIEDYEMILAARDAQIHEDVMQRPGGYDYNMQAGGRDFSGGQRQRFEFARVLAQDPTIAILDEATSALDAKTEHAIMEAIWQRGITNIVIAHRLSTIRDCSQIIVLEHGEAIERGTHEELMKIGGVYTKLITTG